MYFDVFTRAGSTTQPQYRNITTCTYRPAANVQKKSYLVALLGSILPEDDSVRVETCRRLR